MLQGSMSIHDTFIFSGWRRRRTWAALSSATVTGVFFRVLRCWLTIILWTCQQEVLAFYPPSVRNRADSVWFQTSPSPSRSLLIRSSRFRKGSRAHDCSMQALEHDEHDNRILQQSTTEIDYINGYNVPSDTGKAAAEAAPTTPLVLTDQLAELNVVYDTRAKLVYDPEQERFVRQRRKTLLQPRKATTGERTTFIFPLPHWIRSSYFLRTKLLSLLSVAFVPSGVTSNYYTFMQWRILQRFVNANLHVFGTQSLLLGLGIRDTTHNQLGALSAALKWVLKDALGKIVRMAWASRMSLRFDSDAKRWRMRAAFCFAIGNGLEIATFIFPHWFLLWATAANCCKQISMLTSSSTRSSIFFSFRDGSRENIADITAKGEAQVAMVDLMGIGSGVWLSKAVVGTSVRSILAVYVVLQTLEIFCVYKQLRAVQYRVFNFERMIRVIEDFCSGYSCLADSNCSDIVAPALIRTPQEMARKERMFLPPKHLARRQIAFGSLGRSKLTPEELNHLIRLFAGERFLLAVGENVKYPRYSNRWQRLLRRLRTRRDLVTSLQENCHIVLHAQATNVDIVKSTLALTLLRRKLATSSTLDPSTMRSSDCYDLLESSLQEANQMMAPLMRQISRQGWETPARLMFGSVKMRAEWPLLRRPANATTFD